jgi:hypothetical protein
MTDRAIFIGVSPNSLFSLGSCSRLNNGRMSAPHLEPPPAGTTRQIYPLPRKNSKLSVINIHVAKRMPIAVPANSRRVGSRESCFWMTSRSDSITAAVGGACGDGSGRRLQPRRGWSRKPQRLILTGLIFLLRN